MKVDWLVCIITCVVCTGDYGIHVKYNDEHVPNSPAFVHIAPESKDAALVTVHGLRDRGLDVSRQTFHYRSLGGGTGMPGRRYMLGVRLHCACEPRRRRTGEPKLTLILKKP